MHLHAAAQACVPSSAAAGQRSALLPVCVATARPAQHAAAVLASRPQQLQPASRAVSCRSKAHDEEVGLHEAKLGSLLRKSDLKDVNWFSATVTRNDAVTLDGHVRLLHLSVLDKQGDMLYGRRVKGVRDSPRWVDTYTLPGQSVGIRKPDTPASAAKRLYTIASSPYASRRDSAYIDASIIEVVVQRGASAEEDALVGLGPGSELEVSQVIGRGFSSLLNSYGTVTSAIEEKRNLVFVGVGTRGITALRAALNWQPVLAHATGHKVTALYVTRCPAQAAFVPEWDTWRDAGVNFQTLYTEPTAPVDETLNGAAGAPSGSGTGSETTTAAAANGASAAASADYDCDEVADLLEDALFYGEGGFERVAGGKASECCVLLAGLSSALAPRLAKELHLHKVDHERMLFCEYF